MKTRRPLLLAFLAYVFLAFLWIALSDWLLPSLLENSAYLNIWQVLKGIVPLTFTALLFYFLGPRQLAEHSAHTASLRQAIAVFDSTLEGMLITDAEQRIICISRSFTRIIGYTGTEVMGRCPPCSSPAGTTESSTGRCGRR